MKKKSSPTTPVPRQIQLTGGGGGCRAGDGKELQIADPNSPSFAASRAQLPPDWLVVQRPRTRTSRSYGRVDKYYYEPGTGKQFRSLISVHKYLTEGPNYKRSLTMNRRSPPKQMQIVPHSFRSISSADFRLPAGWIIEEKPRRNINYAGIVDRYYIDPETGCRFRSLVSVERYLKGAGGFMAEPKALESSDHFAERHITRESHGMEIVPFGNHSTPSTNRNKHKLCDEVKDSMLDFVARPAKIKWVLSGPSGNIWSPYTSGSAVPGSMRQTWSEAFVSLIQDRS